MNRILAPALATVAAAAVGYAPQTPERVDFQRDVQPIFRQHCYGCHGPTIRENGLRLDRRADAMRGGSIAVIGPGNSAGSRLFLRLTGAPGVGPPMPPTGALRPDQIAIVRKWIDEGAEWPDEAAGEAPPRPTPPLMTAILHGDRATARRLVADGAHVNDRNDAGATALMWAVDDLEMTRLLVDRGADVNARSDDGRTALIVAAGRHGAAPVVTLLLEHRADPSASAPGQGDKTSPLLEAALAGEAETLRLLLAAGADPGANGFVALAYALHADCRACADMLAPKLDAKAASLATLVLIPPGPDPQRIGALLDRGADVNAQDGDGRTLLMRLAASDTAPPALVQRVIAGGARVDARGPHGETALAYAMQRGATPVVNLLLKAGAPAAGEATTTAIPPALPARSPREAVERSIPLLQQTDVGFLKKSGCVSCHNNSLTAMSVSMARSHGIRVDEEIAQEQDEKTGRYLDAWRERALLGLGIAGDHDTISYILLGLAAEGYGATPATDAMARFLLNTQMPDGSWKILAHRPPIESNDVQVTATCLRALQVYAPRDAALRPAFDAAIRRAGAWLLRAEPTVTDGKAFRLLGLGWSHAGSSAIRKAAGTLSAEQRPDGGWSQLPTLASDAYATGQALVALSEGGAIAVDAPAFRRGIEFLMKTQRADGSWYVGSRAIPIQPYFESGFPYGRDQFISAAGTNWATMALALAAK
jgi:ankyrin repeat protein/mono/diheme cytochrome c family protein